MSSLSFARFPAAERARVKEILDRARLSPAEVTLTKVLIPVPGRAGWIREMVTFVHGSVSRTYTCMGRGEWIETFASDLARGLAADGAAAGEAVHRRVVAPPPGVSNLLHGVAVRGDDVQIVEALNALPAPTGDSSTVLRAVILNESGQQYREVHLRGHLQGVCLTASLNALGFKLHRPRRDGRSRRYDLGFSKGAHTAQSYN